MHNYGPNWFEDEYLEKAIEVYNITQEILANVSPKGGFKKITINDIKRSRYWIKIHQNKKSITFDPILKVFNEA